MRGGLIGLALAGLGIKLAPARPEGGEPHAMQGVDGSRAASPKPPERQSREIARRMRQVAAGKLRAENGLAVSREGWTGRHA